MPFVFAATAAAAAAVTGAPAGGAYAPPSAAAPAQRVVISEQGAKYPVGRFVLKGGAGSDDGASDTRSFEGPLRLVDGQYQYTAHGTDLLRGKKGSVKLSWTGTHVDAGSVFVEYGTWRIIDGTGTGTYQRWRGSGRYAATLRATANGFTFSIQREGVVTTG